MICGVYRKWWKIFGVKWVVASFGERRRVPMLGAKSIKKQPGLAEKCQVPVFVIISLIKVIRAYIANINGLQTSLFIFESTLTSKHNI